MALRVDASKQACWLDRVQRWARSNLSVREFCRRHRLSEPSFYSWRRVLHERGLIDEPTATPARPAAFVKLTVAAEAPRATPAVEVVLGRRVLRVQSGFDAEMVRELVRLLEDASC